MISTEVLPCKNLTVAKLLSSRSQPIAISMEDVATEFTGRCFQTCRLCYGSFGTDSPEMPFDQVVELERKFKRMGINTSHGTGGEVLMHGDIGRILPLFGDDGFQLEIDTNGVLIDRPMADLLAKYRVRVTVGLESLDPEIYQWYRGTNHLDRVLGGLDLLKDRGLTPAVQTVVANYKGYPGRYDPVNNVLNLVDQVTNMGLPISLIQYRLLGRATQSTNEVVDLTRLEKDELTRRINLLPSLQRQLVNGDIPFQRQLVVRGDIECSGCLGGLTRANIGVNGDVFMCNWRREETYGNIFTEEFTPIVARLQQRRWQKLDEIEACKPLNCDYRRREQCFGPCLISKMVQPQA